MAGAVAIKNANAATAECLNSLLRSRVRRSLIGTVAPFTIFRGPVRKLVNGFLGALVLVQNAFTQNLGAGVLLQFGVGGDRRRFFGGFNAIAALAHLLAIIMASNFSKFGKRFRP